MDQAGDCDVFIALFNGSAGWPDKNLIQMEGEIQAHSSRLRFRHFPDFEAECAVSSASKAAGRNENVAPSFGLAAAELRTMY
jgi:hypothetical protein